MMTFLSAILGRRYKKKWKKSKILVDNVLSRWIGAVYGSGRIGGCKIEHGRLVITKPRDPMFRFTKDVLKHLKSKNFRRKPNYPELFNNDGIFLWDKAKEQSLKEIKRIEGLWSQFQENVTTEITDLSLALVRWEQGDGKPPPKYFSLTAILDAIYSEVNQYIAEGKCEARPLYVRQEGKPFRLFWTTNCLAESPEEADLQRLKAVVEHLMDDERISKIVDLTRQKKNGEEFEKRFINGLREIINDVELGETLKG